MQNNLRYGYDLVPLCGHTPIRPISQDQSKLSHDAMNLSEQLCILALTQQIICPLYVSLERSVMIPCLECALCPPLFKLAIHSYVDRIYNWGAGCCLNYTKLSCKSQHVCFANTLK